MKVRCFPRSLHEECRLICMPSVYRGVSCIHAPQLGAYASRGGSRTNFKPTYTGKAFAMPQHLETRSNKVRLQGHCRGTTIYSHLDKTHLVATNGHSFMHPSSPRPSGQHPAPSYNVLPQKPPRPVSFQSRTGQRALWPVDKYPGKKA